MNQTTSLLTESITQLQSLTPQKILHFHPLINQSIVLPLRAIKHILLLYPINVIILIVGIYAIVWNVLGRINKNKVQIYWPNEHVQQYDQHIKNLKKDVREAQNEALNLNRKLEMKNKEKGENEQKTEIISEANETKPEVELVLEELIQEGEEMKQIYDEFFKEIKTSENKIIEKLKKYNQ